MLNERPLAWIDAVKPTLEQAGFEVLVCKPRQQAKSKKSVTINPLQSLEADIHERVVIQLKQQYEITIRNDRQVGSVSATTKSNALSPNASWTGVLKEYQSGSVIGEIVVGGARGTATIKFSIDNGQTWSTPVLTAANVLFSDVHVLYFEQPVAGTGPILSMPTGSYVTGDRYTANYVQEIHEFDNVMLAYAEFMRIVSPVLYGSTITPVELSDENLSGIANGNQITMRLETTIALDSGRIPNYRVVTGTTVNFPEATN